MRIENENDNENEKEERLKSLPKASPPEWVSPMLSKVGEKPFDREGWIFEVKWDGYRAIAHTGERVRLYSRNKLNFAKKFSPIVQELEKVKFNAVFDGEVVVVDRQGISRFQLLQDYFQSGENILHSLRYYIFDVLFLENHDIREVPLLERKSILARIVPQAKRIFLSEYVEEKGKSFFQAALRQGLEGIMAKEAASPYLSGVRSSKWLKIKAEERQEAVVAGFTQPQGSRKILGALILGVYEHRSLASSFQPLASRLVYVGHAGGGFDWAKLQEAKRRLAPLITKECPFEKAPKTNTPATWVKPRLVVEVKFREWTKDGQMRQPIFLGFREDKAAQEVRRER